MGQYHRVVNLDKKEFLSPPDFCDGNKIMEFSGGGLTMVAFAALLAISNGRGGGDFSNENDSSLIGSWAGDRVAIVGDYWEIDDANNFRKEKTVYVPTHDTMDGTEWDEEDPKPTFKNISWDILEVIVEDGWYHTQLLESVARYDWGKDWSQFFTDEELTNEKTRQEKERDANNSN